MAVCWRDSCGAPLRRRSGIAVRRLRRRMTDATLVGRRDRDADQLLDVAQEGALLAVAERDRDAVGAGARGAADAVDVALRDVRQVEIDDVADAVDVDAARRDVGRHQHADLAGRGTRRARARAGSATCCRGSPRRAMLRLGERTHDLVGAVLGAGEDQHAVDRLAAQQLRQQRGLGGAVDQITRWSMRSTVVAAGVTATRTGSFSMELASSVISRGMVAEKNRVWRLAGSLRDDAPDVVDEAHVEHAVGFVEHEDLDAVELHGAVRHQVEQPPGRRHQHVDAVGERAHLRVDVHAADGERNGRAQVAAVGLEAVDDLRRQLARRAQHQHAAALGQRRVAVVGEVIEDRAARKRRSCRFRSARCRRRRGLASLAGWFAPGSAWAWRIVRRRGLV